MVVFLPQEAEAAKRAIMHSRMQGERERRRKEDERVPYDGRRAGDFGGRSGRELTDAELREYLPSPRREDYDDPAEYAAAKRAVDWAREQARRLGPGERMPSPRVGSGPGEYATEEVRGVVAVVGYSVGVIVWM